MTHRPLLSGLAASAAILLPASSVDAQSIDYETALKRYKTCIVRLPFRFHTDGRHKLARTVDPRALAILAKDYASPKAYPDFSRYTIASMLGRYFTDQESVPTLQRLRAAHDDPGDAWLWMHALGLESEAVGAEQALKIATSAKSVVHRGAAIAGLASRGNPIALETVPANCAAMPKKPAERRLLIGAMAEAILANKHRRQDPTMDKALRAFIGLLAPENKHTHSAKMVIARYLSKTIGKDVLYIEPEPWIRLLDQGFEPPKREGQTVAGLRFFGIEAEGDRICYLIDLSDSMCKKVDPGIITKHRGPITGPKKKKKKKRGAIPDESDIPWDKIVTRWDLAREHLKISLLRLPKDKRFCVAWFGTEAGMLPSCKGMIKASKTNIRRVIRDLESIHTAPPKPPDAPDGVLRGRTNLHAGMRFAFSLRAKGLAKRHEYVDMKALAEGCDTIFLLSDGAPSWDNFAVRDKYYPNEGRVVRDTEYGKEAPPTPFLIYQGPYDQPHWLEDDIRRLNLFRKVQIHCIGIGEANVNLLRSIAENAMGETYLFGKQAKSNGRRK